MLSIKLLPAEYGDSLLISIGESEPFNILLDGGTSNSYKSIKKEIYRLKQREEKINLMVCTHMDNDHIGGLIQILKNENAELVENVWYNGFLQMVRPDFYNKEDNKFTKGDNEILDHIISQGLLPDTEQNIGINDGMSLGVLIQEKGIPLNMIADGYAICSDTLSNRIEIEKDVYIYIVGPSKDSLDRVEEYWGREMVSKNFMFRVSNKIKLMEAFEYQMERIKSQYTRENIKVCESDDLQKYIGDLLEEDDSITNRSSVSFVLEYKEKKYLFLGDSVIDSSILKVLEDIVGREYRFSVIKLPHHGSRYNITHEFIDRYTADEYYCLTNSERFDHPDLEVLASIICNDPRQKRLVFNYPIKKVQILNNENWKEKYNYELIVGDGENPVERLFL